MARGSRSFLISFFLIASFISIEVESLKEGAYNMKQYVNVKSIDWKENVKLVDGIIHYKLGRILLPLIEVIVEDDQIIWVF